MSVQSRHAHEAACTPVLREMADAIDDVESETMQNDGTIELSHRKVRVSA